MNSIRIKRLILTVSIIILLSGCSTWRKFDDTEKGAVIGGGSGALIGNVIAPGVGGTVVGGAMGALGGGLIGKEIEKDDKRKNN